MRNFNKKPEGFTLIELLLAMTILAFITATVWSSLFSIVDTKSKVEERDDFQQMVRIVLDRLTKDLSLAFIIPQAQKMTGFVGESEKLTFTTFAHEEIDPDLKECEETLITYSLERDEKRPTLYVFKRKENKRLKDDFSEDEGKPVELLNGVSKLKFEYYDGEKFSDRWSNESIETKQKDKIPRAVKINLDVKDEKDFEHHYYTMVNIQLSRVELSRFNPPSVPSPGEGGTPPEKGKPQEGGKQPEKGKPEEKGGKPGESQAGEEGS